MLSFLSFLVQLDPKLQEVIVLAITFVVSYVLLQLSAAVPWLAAYIGQYKAGIITWLSGLVFNLLQAALNRVPATWDTVLVLVMQLIAEVVIILLGFAAIRKYQLKGHAALQ